ncbi:hypothetical protein [Aerococcus kribbianus]|uniref:Uncharacterized protein n=1 Tax=Aerococcus kribbianus TaxID=2999064 RepID=A0A9X3FNW0_9LACT|nr:MULTISPECIES: hypothetical protein [unclassified Aerococcus]MCZ0717866.1 hypothetical protein [Aerococcus sp. YH-aer221]MCZ0726153.1 hypothetical protein [Aerococcus sp. YH-aer222]
MNKTIKTHQNIIVLSNLLSNEILKITLYYFEKIINESVTIEDLKKKRIEMMSELISELETENSCLTHYVVEEVGRRLEEKVQNLIRKTALQ